MMKTLYDSTTEPYIGLYIFDQPYLLLRNLDLIRKVIISDFDYFMDRVAVTTDNDKVGSKILFLLKGQDWKDLRKTSTSLYSFNQVKHTIPLMNVICDDFVKHIDRNIDKGGIDCRSVAFKYAIDIVSSCAFGFEANALQDSVSVFVKAALQLFDVSITRGMQLILCFFCPKLVTLFNCKFLDVAATNTMVDIFKKVRDERKISQKKRGDLIDMLNNITVKGNKLDEDYLSALAIQTLVGGYETSGITISFIFYELCQNVDVQNRLRDEIRSVLRYDDKNINYETINNMTYLDMVVNETLRKYPPLGFLDRRCSKNYRVPNCDLTIEKGTVVFVPTFALHYDEKYYPEPEKFNPERFSPSNKLFIPKCAYLPFGDGMRNCLGMRLAILTVKMCIIKSILNFKIEICDDTPKSIKFDPISLLLRPHNNEIKLKFVRI